MNGGSDAIFSPSAGELASVSQLWRRERRVLVTTFSGTSMMPSISPGQKVAVECGLDPCIGDVVVFLRDNHIGVHRLVARCRDGLLTWGDANPLPDDPIEPGRVVGTIRQVPPAPASLYRTALLVWLAAGDVPRTRRRLQFAYRLHGALAAGPVSLAGKIVRRLNRMLRS
jgi:hypothetical protein